MLRSRRRHHETSFPSFDLCGCKPNAGGGATLLHLSELIPAFRDTLVDLEEKLGADIVMKSLRAPCRIIANNAGAAACHPRAPCLDYYSMP